MYILCSGCFISFTFLIKHSFTLSLIITVEMTWCGQNVVLSSLASLRFNGHFPGGPGLADTRMSPFWIILELRTGQHINFYQHTNVQYWYGFSVSFLPTINIV